MKSLFMYIGLFPHGLFSDESLFRVTFHLLSTLLVSFHILISFRMRFVFTWSLSARVSLPGLFVSTEHSVSLFSYADLVPHTGNIPLKMPHLQNPPIRETQISRYKLKSNQNLNLNLHREIPKESERLVLVDLEGTFPVETVV